MTNYRPLIYSLIIVFVLGIILNLTLSSFININNINTNSVLFSNSFSQVFVIDALCYPTFIDSVDTGVSFLGFNLVIPYINPYALMPNVFIDFGCNQIIIMSYIPDLLLIPLLIVLTFAFIYGLIKIFLP